MSNAQGCGLPGTGYPSDCEITEGLRQRALARSDQEGGGYAWRACLSRAKEIRLLLLDVDGVLTDSSIVYGSAGTETKSFSSKDGFGIRLLREAGVEVGIITARNSEAVALRARDLNLSHIYQGVRNKLTALEEIVAAGGFSFEQIAYMGDDWLDLAVLTRVGLALAVADAVAEVREVAHYVTRQSGGRGAVREICDLLIDARGILSSLT